MKLKALAVVTAALATAAPVAPAFAADKGASDHAGPIPYGELAAADAKLNGSGATTHKARRHAAKHRAAKTPAAAASGSTGAAAPAGAASTTAPASGTAPAR